MALTWIGGKAIDTSVSTSQLQIPEFGEMKRLVAKVLNASSDPVILAEAGDAIIWALRKINLITRFDFTRTAKADVNLVEDQLTYALDVPRWAGVSVVQLIAKSGGSWDSDAGRVLNTLQGVPWDEWQERCDPLTQEGTPLIWSIENSMVNNQLLVYPHPRAQDVTDYTLRIVHFQRIAEPTEDGDVIAIPRPGAVAVEAGGRYKLLKDRDRSNVAGWASEKQDFEEAVGQLQGLDRRNEDPDRTSFYLELH